jgi:hypothetical protein
MFTASRKVPAAPIALSWISRWIAVDVTLQEGEPPPARAMAPLRHAVSVTSKRVKGRYVVTHTITGD